MNIALLIHDARTSITFIEIIESVVKKYYRKYGVEPTHCHINPKQYEENKDQIKDLDIGVEVVSDEKILINNFWVGNGSLESYQDYLGIQKIIGKELEV